LRLRIARVNQQIAGLAIEKITNFFQRVEAYAFNFALLEQGHICFGDAASDPSARAACIGAADTARGP
jgi:hypothetical protein